MRAFIRGLVVGVGLFAGMWAMPGFAAPACNAPLGAVVAELSQLGFRTENVPQDHVKPFLKALRHSGVKHIEGMDKLKVTRVELAFNEGQVFVILTEGDCVGAVVGLTAEHFAKVVAEAMKGAK